MKTILFMFLFMSTFIYGQDLEVGYSQVQVLSVLGEPQGKMSTGKLVIWSYPRGIVKFKDGIVFEFDLLSDKGLQDKAEKIKHREADQKSKEEYSRFMIQEYRRKIDETYEIARIHQGGYLTEKQKEDIQWWKDFIKKFEEDIR